jgi:hypothetical protein
MTSSYHISIDPATTTTPKQRQPLRVQQHTTACTYYRDSNQFFNTTLIINSTTVMLRESSRTPARGDLDLAPRGDLTQTLFSMASAFSKFPNRPTCNT